MSVTNQRPPQSARHLSRPATSVGPPPVSGHGSGDDVRLAPGTLTALPTGDRPACSRDLALFARAAEPEAGCRKARQKLGDHDVILRTPMSVRRTSRDFRHLRAREDPGSFRTFCDGVYAEVSWPVMTRHDVTLSCELGPHV